MLTINNIEKLNEEIGYWKFLHGYTIESEYVIYVYEDDVYSNIICIDRNETILKDIFGLPVAGYTVSIYDGGWTRIATSRTWEFELKEKYPFFSKFPHMIKKARD